MLEWTDKNLHQCVPHDCVLGSSLRVIWEDRVTAVTTGMGTLGRTRTHALPLLPNPPQPAPPMHEAVARSFTPSFLPRTYVLNLQFQITKRKFVKGIKKEKKDLVSGSEK